MEPTLDLRARNRALLARQWLLEPRTATSLEAIEHLVGLQAQDVKAPYYQLAARLKDFAPEQLSGLLESRDAVRIAALRSTIHLVSARDAAPLRALAQPTITRATDQNWAIPDTIDRATLAVAGRELIDAEPRTAAQLRDLLGADPRFAGADPAALAQQIRALVPLVQVPPRGIWGRSGPPAHTSLRAWCGSEEPDADLDDLVLRYLGAFGPATIKDMQKWSGATRLAAAFARVRERLVVFTDAETRRRELYDLPDAPRPDPAQTPAPPRLVGPFDNLILSHADGTHVLPVEHRPKVMTQNGLIAGLVLVDGFVAGNWRITAATLTIATFASKAYKKTDAAALAAQAERLLAFTAPDADARRVVFTPPGS